MYAALKMSENNSLPMTAYDMNVSVRVNVHEQIMLLHDEPFDQIPLWIRYKNVSRLLEILFEDGRIQTLPVPIEETAHKYLIKSAKVTLVLVENNKAVEGWDTVLLNDTYQ